MANLPESSTYEAGIYQLETSDPVLGGVNGISNQQGKQLANRTKYLKDHVDLLEAGTGIGDGTLTAAKMAKGGVLRSSDRNTVLTGKTSGGKAALVGQSDLKEFILLAGGSNPNIIYAFAGGFNQYGPIDYFAQVSVDENVDVSAFLADANTDVYIVVEYDSGTNALTYLATDKPLINSIAEPSSPGNGQFWFHLGEHKMYKRVAGAWVQKYAVFIGGGERNGSGELTAVYTYPYGTNASETKYMPKGAVIAYAADEPRWWGIPKGYLVCNGAAINRTTYAELFEQIGTTFGSGNGTTTFNLPDLRGEFVRGWDDGRGVDSGRTFGSAQAEDIGDHTHALYTQSAGNIANSGATTYATTSGNSDSSSAVQTLVSGGTENRPRNIALVYLIKY